MARHDPIVDEQWPADNRDEPANAQRMLLRFLQHRDVACPRCGYNLRNLTQPVCPECREALSLKIGVQRLALWPMFITLAPGAFCAVALGIFVVMSTLHGFPSLRRDPEIWLVVGFMVFSAAAAIVIAVRNRAFMRLAVSTQVGICAAIWAAHLVIFIIIASRM